MKRFKKTVITMSLIVGVMGTTILGSNGAMAEVFDNNVFRLTKAYAAIEFKETLEAEEATMTGSVTTSTSRPGYSGTGYATGFTQSSSNSWSMKVTLPATQHYTITVRSASDSYKENYLLINGKQVGTIYSVGDGTWHDTVLNSVYLEAGTVTLSIGEYWGWFDLDCITIETGSGIADSVYENATSTLVNPNANAKTKEIMKYLKSIYGKHTLSGQSCTLNTDTEAEALYSFTGRYPAVRLFDMIFCSPASSWQNDDEVKLAKQWDKKGGLVSFQWHWHAPKGGASFYTSQTAFDISKAVTSYDLSRKSLDEIKSMYESGLITEECYLLVRDIDVISDYLNSLQQDGVTILWRPLHEASGGWFWWGAKGADAYLWLYKLMFNRQTYYHQLNNLIWVWNGQDDEWYPGDAYCDIVGTDIYADGFNYSAQPDQFMKTVNYSGGRKMATLSENGVMMDPDLMIRDNTYWLWFGVWYGDFLMTNGSIGSSYTEASMVYKVYNSDVVITLDELPTFGGGGTTPTPTITPTITPTVTPTVTVTPTITPTPVPSGSFTLSLTNTGNSAISSNTITNNFQITHVSGEDIDLSKLKIRYYYTKEGSATETFYCDTAAVQLNKAPWYIPYTSNVKGTINTITTPKSNASSYIEISIDTNDTLTQGSTLTLNTRVSKSDWSAYDQSNDYSYNDNSKVVVYYDGKVILGIEP